MENINIPSVKLLREVITDLQEPILFKNMLRDVKSGKYIWKIFEWDFAELSNIFGDKELPFRTGYNAASLDPQWEVNCPVKVMTLREFLDETNSCPNNKIWHYFDYKHMEEWFKDKPDVLQSVNWKVFGFDKAGCDSTLWIGNKGAHTNCHQDSYGCNLVAQIRGRKQWLLFPPSSTNILRPTRIPYEESTVYSALNFFSPTQESIEIIKKIPEKAKMVVLEAGDVLFVPKGWWHYVESLDLSISVNVWLPLETDDRARVEEALVKLLVTTVGENISQTAENQAVCSHSYCAQLISATLKKCQDKGREVSRSRKRKRCSAAWLPEDLTENYPNHVQLIKGLQVSELQQVLTEKGSRFPDNVELKNPYLEQSSVPYEQVSKTVLNTFCHPDVVNKVADLLLNTNVISAQRCRNS